MAAIMLTNGILHTAHVIFVTLYILIEIAYTTRPEPFTINVYQAYYDGPFLVH